MTKFQYSYINKKLYCFNKDSISVDDFITLEEIAALENEDKKHKIFFVYKLEEGLKVFTSLN